MNCSECGLEMLQGNHIKVNGECINSLGRKECHCFDFIQDYANGHWSECPEFNKAVTHA